MAEAPPFHFRCGRPRAGAAVSGAARRRRRRRRLAGLGLGLGAEGCGPGVVGLGAPKVSSARAPSRAGGRRLLGLSGREVLGQLRGRAAARNRWAGPGRACGAQVPAGLLAAAPRSPVPPRLGRAWAWRGGHEYRDPRSVPPARLRSSPGRIVTAEPGFSIRFRVGRAGCGSLESGCPGGVEEGVG